MKKRKLLPLFFFSVFSISGQDYNYSRELVNKLSSPEFKGRGYVEDGNKIAAEYIRNEFKNNGLKAFKKDFYQKFKIIVNTFPSNMILEIDGIQLKPGEEYIVDPLSNSLKGSFEVVQITKEDLLDDNKLKNIIKSSVGKVLLIDETGFKIEDKENEKKVDDRIKFLKYSPQVLTSAVIVYTNDKLTWSNATAQAPRPSFIVKKDFDIKNIKTIKIDIKADLIKYQTQNIVGYVEGIEKPDSFLVVLAHYDHLGKMGSEVYFPGANDNASGTAMLLNLATYYRKNPHACSVVFIALSAEEIGIVGAKYFVDNPLFDLKKIKFLVNFDLAGTGDDGIKVVNGSVYRDKFDLLTKINSQNNYLKTVQIRGAACNSDHCMFDEKGVPCFYIYTLGGIQAYHDIYDRAETLPLTEIVDYCKLMIGFFDSF